MYAIIAVAAGVAAFLAEYYHDRLSINYITHTNSNIPPWTRKETMRRKVWKTLRITFALSCLQWFDMVGIIGMRLPLYGIAAGSIAGSLWAVWCSMWEDWKEAHARFVGPMALARLRRRGRGSDSEQSVEGDPDQTTLLEE